MAATVQDAIMLFGDSITQMGWSPGGFGARLTDVYCRRFDVLNRGFGGYNTKWAMPVLERCLEPQQNAPKIRIFVLWLGANDAAILPSRQHVPLDEYINNIESMVRLVRTRDESTKIILVTPPPISEAMWAAQLKENDPAAQLDRKFDTTKEYAQSVVAVAAKMGVSVVDVWDRIWTAAGARQEALSQYLSDGLHLTAAGYAIAYDALMENIKEEHASLHYEQVNPTFPPWPELGNGV
ncbi:SGNH hydrolase-type esterase domain-containing protein [Roridomyces roridus]|uniref:SGNH hydrolase-type esterase domain-containing protein n=1 Tax=Roridomyces roridus TaxID=1738132 RepID=A0AAD7FM80_9AGAR|nr:SGNH hydrolase-type esterase domain-containing protein [Roridomyces roridus]